MPQPAIGSQWFKFDFHTHTPASIDYRDQEIPNEVEWLKAVMQAEIDCVAITDHNSGSWINKLKETYINLDKSEQWYRPLHIFPGCEITISTGASSIHLLALFDPSVDSNHITVLLDACGICDDFGDPERTSSTESLETIIAKVKQAGGLSIPAHIEGSKGLLENVRNINPDIQKSLNLIDAAQFLKTTHLDTVHPELKQAASHIAVVRGSDAHSIIDLGRSFTWVKMDIPSLTALEFALKNNDLCILNQEENPNMASIEN
ncbi:hypothetical protein MD588_10550 [Photobacterium sp. SDRW27]|uniref:hypothetical protein n=1 Tax=Photobacterium obscurum TaxID=2829490 RepID=UPI002243C41C|nr:hypothetical protein [Photobacterium obscurum]MCW8329245.1 hypothetical protein [Photobacterium obscurum]